ncbi:MAG: hypothetical protein Q6365_024325 [Candidatus Sigynarchaeota archaeon]
MDDTGSYGGSCIGVHMESNADFAIPPGGRFVVVLEPAVLDLVDGLGLEQDAREEVIGLLATIPPEQHVAYVVGLYDELAGHLAEPDDADW